MTRTTALLGLFSALLLVGCSDKPNSYDVSVTNKIDKDVTVWITKDNPPFEPGWAPPEEIAMETSGNKVVGGVVVKPGMTVNATLSGQTTPDNPAMLRVYQATNMNSILALSRGNPKRIDSALVPGRTHADVVMEDNALSTNLHHIDTPEK